MDAVKIRTWLNARDSVFGCEKIETPSLVEPGQAIPMNRLVTGVINGTIRISDLSRDNMRYDFAEKTSAEFVGGATAAEQAAAANAQLVKELDDSANLSDPTASPSFDAIDAENLANSLSSQGAIEGRRADSAEGAAAPKQPGGDDGLEPARRVIPTSDGEDKE